jgi:hypothetical protein
MGGKMAKSLYAVVAVALTALGVGSASAGSVSSSDTWGGDYGLLQLPSGTFAALDYIGYSKNNDFVDTSGHHVGGHAQIWSNIARVAYVTELAGTKIALEAALPYAKLSGVDIGGVSETTHGGFFSPVLFQSVGLILNPKEQRILALTSYEYLPVGDYDNKSLINVATPKQFVWVPQVGYSEGLKKFGLDGFFFELVANASFHADGKNPYSESPVPYGGYLLPGVAAYSTAKQETSYNVKAFLLYQWCPICSAAIGIEKSWGGLLTYTNGSATITGIGTIPLANEQVSKDDYLRGHFQLGLPLARDIQIALDVHHDFTRAGGFQESFGAELRLLKLFVPAAPAKAPMYTKAQ